jgi:hypothetical protein
VRGSRLFDNFQKVALLVLYSQSGKSPRYFTTELNRSLVSWKHWLRLKNFPSKSTPNLWLKTFNLDFIKNLLIFTILEVTCENVAIDGSGVDT